MNPEVLITIKADDVPIITLTVDEAKRLYDALNQMFGEQPTVNPYAPYLIYPSQPQPIYKTTITCEKTCSD